MTATEVQVRYELMQRLLGPTLGRFQSEFLNPLIDRVFGIMFRAGAFREPPEIMGGQQIDVEFIGPLARSQRMEEATAVERLYQLAMEIGQADPSVLDLINNDVAIRMRATLLGVPKSVLRGEDEVEELRQQRAEQQQQMQEQQMMAEQAKAMKDEASAMQTLAQPEVDAAVQQAQTEIEEVA